MRPFKHTGGARISRPFESIFAAASFYMLNGGMARRLGDARANTDRVPKRLKSVYALFGWSKECAGDQPHRP